MGIKNEIGRLRSTVATAVQRVPAWMLRSGPPGRRPPVTAGCVGVRKQVGIQGDGGLLSQETFHQRLVAAQYLKHAFPGCGIIGHNLSPGRGCCRTHPVLRWTGRGRSPCRGVSFCPLPGSHRAGHQFSVEGLHGDHRRSGGNGCSNGDLELNHAPFEFAPDL